MRTRTPALTAALTLSLILLLIGCDSLALPTPTAQVIVITGEPTATPTRTPTPPPTATAPPTITPSPTATAEAVAAARLCDEDTGALLSVDKFYSSIADENLRYKVYVPPCYSQTQARYPVVYLLHGAGSTEQQWSKLGVTDALDQGLASGALPPMILVMPYMGSIGAQNIFPPAPSYASVISDEIVPAIDRDFCTWSNRAHRAIGGISRGGFWTFSVGLTHPDLFGILGGHSAFFDDGSSPATANPLELALNDPALPGAGLRIYLDNGASDQSAPAIELFSSRLSARGIQHTYTINPVGGHDDDYWSAHLSEYLTFYGRDWPRNPADMPSCLEPSP
jgi:enterochelin esterase-like enzyme